MGQVLHEALRRGTRRRQTEPAAIGLALDYIDRGFSAVEIKTPAAAPGSARSSYWRIQPSVAR
jgi:hypothetical protein